jgi:hypothetical protein
MFKLMWTSFGPPSISLISWVTLANWKPFFLHHVHKAFDFPYGDGSMKVSGE